RGAVRGQARARVQVEVDLLPRPVRAAAVDVEDVEAVEDGEAHRVACLVGQLAQVRCGDLADLHRADRGEAEIEDARPQPVLPRPRVLLQVAEAGERRRVAVRGAPRQPDRARQLAHAELGDAGAEGGQ